MTTFFRQVFRYTHLKRLLFEVHDLTVGRVSWATLDDFMLLQTTRLR